MTTCELRNGGARLALVLILGLGLSANATAGDVYSWTTDEGVHSFTNDQKRIPARYATSAKRRTVESLSSYDRYTPGPKLGAGDYSARLEKRLSGLRERAGAVGPEMARSARSSRAGSGMLLDWRQNNRRGSSLGLALPISQFDGNEDAPLITQSVRLPRQGTDMSTHHADVVRRGGKIVAVFEAERNDGPLP